MLVRLPLVVEQHLCFICLRSLKILVTQKTFFGEGGRVGFFGWVFFVCFSVAWLVFIWGFGVFLGGVVFEVFCSVSFFGRWVLVDFLLFGRVF